MIINVNQKWQLSSDIRSWAIRRRQEKTENWRSVAWARNLDEARHYLLRQGVAQSLLDTLEEMLGCRDSSEERRPRPFCWRFDEVFARGSPEADFLARVTIPPREGQDAAKTGRKRSRGTSTPPREKERVFDGQMRLEWASKGRVLIQASPAWRIREAKRSWEVERLAEPKSGKTGDTGNHWKFEASCINLLDAFNTLLQRRVWLIEGDDPTEIIEQREAIRNEIISAWRRTCQAAAA
jgi:hypothetical protein